MNITKAAAASGLPAMKSDTTRTSTSRALHEAPTAIVPTVRGAQKIAQLHTMQAASRSVTAPTWLCAPIKRRFENIPAAESVADKEVATIKARFRALLCAQGITKGMNHGPKPIVWKRHTIKSAARDHRKGWLLAVSSALTQNSVVPTRCRIYYAVMAYFGCSFSIHRLMALIMCVSLMVTGMSASVAMEHSGHAGDRNTVEWAASSPAAAGHAAHHMLSGEAEAECCEPETTGASSCQVSACCISELQHPMIAAFTDLARSARARAMVNAAGLSIDTPLPERPPRLS